MADPQNFIDNLRNLKVVVSVALEHIQENRDGFAEHATGVQIRDFDRLIAQLRTLAEQLEKEFDVAESLISKRSPKP